MISRRGVIAFAFVIAGIVGNAPAFAQSGNGSARPAQDYVTKAAIGDMFEIQSSKLALHKSSDAKVKSFATRMIKDHTAGSAKLKSIIKAEELPLVPPTKLDDAHQQMIDSLSASNGSEFDKMFHEMQMQTHQEALALHESYAETGMEPKLKAFAKKTSAVVKRHLEMLQASHFM